jgi:exosome complex RNA-binding protein Csl4
MTIGKNSNPTSSKIRNSADSLVALLRNDFSVADIYRAGVLLEPNR